MARFRIQLAEGIAEGYTAFYRQDGVPWLLSVEGLRFDMPEAAEKFSRTARATRNAANVIFRSGAIVVVQSGPAGACFEAVRGYLVEIVR